jgi:hypothetical protein
LEVGQTAGREGGRGTEAGDRAKGKREGVGGGMWKRRGIIQLLCPPALFVLLLARIKQVARAGSNCSNIATYYNKLL